ncbi:hypothetical protein [Methylomicrobium sp. Wu6]|uniref:hypothetical protein n=1 Tax=Methylomicrobium sp. Wu6 TaxID=3107928 RepID=UPI002DD62A80|nr:hypothetical protein [Methylomicrobium sp. Wu6]MEC4747448.1 hypothetical protein [Methylomicrobium sp. Wu6]
MDKALIAEASKKLRLRSIILYEGNLKRFESLPEAGELGQQIKSGVKSEILSYSDVDEQSPLFRVFTDLGVRVVKLTGEPETEPEPLFQIEAIFQIDYEMTDTVEQAALEEFAKYNAVHNVWPFWRQYVFSMANQAGLPCPEIPLNTCFQSLENDSEKPV